MEHETETPTMSEFNRRVEGERAERVEWSNATSEALATAMGMGWEKVPGNWENWRALASIRHPDGREICIARMDKGRLAIRGHLNGLHQHAGYKVSNPEITVTQAKTWEQIAKEITRRVLPFYNEAWNTAKANRVRFEELVAITTGNALELATAGRGEVNHPNGSETTRSVYYVEPFSTLSVTGDTVRFESFSCTMEQALAIIAATRKAEEGRGQM